MDFSASTSTSSPRASLMVNRHGIGLFDGNSATRTATSKGCCLAVPDHRARQTKARINLVIEGASTRGLDGRLGQGECNVRITLLRRRLAATATGDHDVLPAASHVGAGSCVAAGRELRFPE